MLGRASIRFLVLFVPCMFAALASYVTLSAAHFDQVDASASKGGAASAEEWRKLVEHSQPSDVPELLAQLDGAEPIAANWLRSAIDAVAERAAKQSAKLPSKELEAFVVDRAHKPQPRRMAYELLQQADRAMADGLLDRMLDDPSVELRRDAVARVLSRANDAASEAEKIERYQSALVAARDEDQVNQASEALKKLGREVDLAAHYGYLMRWQLVGPFDNVGKKGFTAVYSPEQDPFDFKANFTGKSGSVAWIGQDTTAPDGKVDLNKAVGKNMGAAAYARTDFESKDARPAELRISTPNAHKVWLNGKLIGEAEVYHANTLFDQYVHPCTLRAGANVILVKLCQNEQTESWAQDWTFSLRVCDSSGTAILSADRAVRGAKE